MIRFVLYRLVWLVLTMWVVFTVTFALIRAVPGGPFDSEKPVPPEVKRTLERRYNMDKSIPVQYALELARLSQGDFGYAMKMGDYSVNSILRDGLPISAALGILALAFAVTLGLLTGVVSAAFRGTAADVALRLVTTVGIAVPNFVIAGVCILQFVFLVPLFPAAGWGDWRQLVLPAFCLGAPFAAEVARISRTSLLDALSNDYIRTAQAKGAGRARVLFVHGLRNALLPVVSFLGPASAGVLTGSLVIEKIFGIPGLGVYFVTAALLRDWTVLMGVVLLDTLVICTMNLLVDVSYAWLDPRVKLE
jgi:ABC-type dipeptide/oligopeptide/nickel transport system permease component